MSLRKCTKCGLKASTDADLVLFMSHPHCKYGRTNLCYKCRYGYKQGHAAKKQERLDDLKDVPCADCGVRYPPRVMDFDHVRGEKKFIMSQGVWHRSWESILEEVEKCDVVCSNCHRLRTFS